MGFWASYILLKEGQGVSRDITLKLIGSKLGTEKRVEIEKELHANKEL